MDALTHGDRVDDRVRTVRDAGPADRCSARLRGRGELETDRRELQRVPPLSDRAPRARQGGAAVPVRRGLGRRDARRRQRDGGGRDLVHDRGALRAPAAPRTAARGPWPVLRVVPVPEPDAQPAPRLRHVLHRLSEGSLAHHGRLRVPVPAGGHRRPRTPQARAGGRAVGPDLQAGLEGLRARADRRGSRSFTTGVYPRQDRFLYSFNEDYRVRWGASRSVSRLGGSIVPARRVALGEDLDRLAAHARETLHLRRADPAPDRPAAARTARRRRARASGGTDAHAPSRTTGGVISARTPTRRTGRSRSNRSRARGRRPRPPRRRPRWVRPALRRGCW